MQISTAILLVLTGPLLAMETERVKSCVCIQTVDGSVDEHLIGESIYEWSLVPSDKIGVKAEFVRKTEASNSEQPESKEKRITQPLDFRQVSAFDEHRVIAAKVAMFADEKSLFKLELKGEKIIILTATFCEEYFEREQMWWILDPTQETSSKIKPLIISMAERPRESELQLRFFDIVDGNVKSTISSHGVCKQADPCPPSEIVGPLILQANIAISAKVRRGN